MKTVKLSEYKLCDLCKYFEVHPVRVAQYDAPTIYGRWGNLCPMHYELCAPESCDSIVTKFEYS